MVSLHLSILLVSLFCVHLYQAEDMQVGTIVNVPLAYSESVELSAIPLTRRTKNVFYNSDNSSKIIKGIVATDMDKSDAKVSITAGGVGSMYVNIKIKGEKGERLKYLVQIFI